METDAEKQIPETLFKYCDEGALTGLDSGTMMFSKPLDLNDPYEFLPDLSFLFGGVEQQKHLRLDLESFGYSPYERPPGCLLTDRAHHWIRKVSGDWFITSLSEADHNVRMWAQYSGNHTGLKLTLKLPQEFRENIKQVHYEDARVSISDLGDPKVESHEKGDLLKRLATTKGKDWEHEKELRWFFHPQIHPYPHTTFDTKLLNGKMKAFVPLGDDCIARVTLGYRSSESLLSSLLEIRKKRKARWEVAKAKLSLHSFQFEEELLQIPDES